MSTSDAPVEEGGEEFQEPTLGEKVWEQVSTLGLAVLIALATCRI